tara:strand:- start:579 stop:785 length:207 start_codon:yes stop_codon:yes gene_type:complete
MAASAMKKYRQTARGKAANNRCSAKYYKEHKAEILAKHRQKVECFFCGGWYNQQYFKRKHFLCCPALN